MNDAATLIAQCLMIAGGALLAAAILAAACALAWILGTLLWRRITRIYRIRTIWHYLEQLEKTGRYRFPPPGKENP